MRVMCRIGGVGKSYYDVQVLTAGGDVVCHSVLIYIMLTSCYLLQVLVL